MRQNTPHLRLETPVLLAGNMPPAIIAMLESSFRVIRCERTASGPVITAEHSATEVYFTNAVYGASRAVLHALPNLKLVCSCGVGVDAIDLSAARELNIAVSNTPGVLGDCVADLAFGLLLDIGRAISEADRFVRSGSWRSGGFRQSTRVSRKKLGIVGMGNIGRLVAQRSSGFDMQVRYTGRRAVKNTDLLYEPSLVKLANWSDFLVVCVAGGPATENLISEGVLNALGPQGYLINVARGSVVDEIALLRALEQRTIAGAALDVHTSEPTVRAQFMSLDNVVLTPHVGPVTHETRQAVFDLALRNLHQFLKDGTLLTPA